MKKNLRKIPPEILEKVKNISSRYLVVSATKKYKTGQLFGGILLHLGVSLDEKGLHFPKYIVPSGDQGSYSNRNINGEEIIRKDLKKRTGYSSIEAPNWGDPYKGYHTVDLPYEYYPKEFIPPIETEILLYSPNTRPSLEEYILVFKVNEVLDKTSPQFKRMLLRNINLMQENIGAIGVESSDKPMREYITTLNLSWEILPPGTKDEAINRLFKGREISREERDVAEDRYKYFMSLRPSRLIYGSSGFRRYFGAMIREDLVVFENILYGNAVYIMFTNWKELSKKTRLELLSGKYGKEFDRVQHKKGWKTTVKLIIDKQLKKK
ncbi:MAG: hypothetical protein EHM20_07190 [Alphaproteobacteria bacterium]|nr:MAG: hypothetical protein EHM20_07190 [Alphaproteobacteria bacterium]